MKLCIQFVVDSKYRLTLPKKKKNNKKQKNKKTKIELAHLENFQFFFI